MSTATRRPRQHVYRGGGGLEIRFPPCDPIDSEHIGSPTVADSIPATWIMTRNVFCAREDLVLDKVIDLVLEERIGCIPVVNPQGCPIGMITKQDLVEHVLTGRDPEAVTALTARQLMMPLAFTLDEHATVAHAAAMMSVEGVHHVPIVSDIGEVIGVVSALDIVRWLATNDGLVTPR